MKELYCRRDQLLHSELLFYFYSIFKLPHVQSTYYQLFGPMLFTILDCGLSSLTITCGSG